MLTYPPSLLNLCGSDAEVAWRLCHGLDLRIEASQRLDGSIQGTLDRVSPWILNEIGAGGLGLLIHDQSDPWTDDITPDLSTAATFFVGHDPIFCKNIFKNFNPNPPKLPKPKKVSIQVRKQRKIQASKSLAS